MSGRTPKGKKLEDSTTTTRINVEDFSGAAPCSNSTVVLTVRALEKSRDEVERWLVIRFGLSRDDASDIFSETLAAILERGNLEAIEQPRAYMFKAVRNRANNWLRDKKSDVSLDDPSIGIVTMLELPAETDLVDTSEVLDAFVKKLRHLVIPRFRTRVVLHRTADCLFGFLQREIVSAIRTGLSNITPSELLSELVVLVVEEAGAPSLAGARKRLQRVREEIRLIMNESGFHFDNEACPSVTTLFQLTDAILAAEVDVQELDDDEPMRSDLEV